MTATNPDHDAGEDRSGPALWRNHIPLIVSSIGLGLLAVRLLVVGGGSTTTALGLLQEASPTSVLIGTLVPTMALGSVAALVLLVSDAGDRLIEHKRIGVATTSATAAVVLLALFLIPMGSLILLPLTFLFEAQRVRRRRRQEEATAKVESTASGDEPTSDTSLDVDGPVPFKTKWRAALAITLVVAAAIPLALFLLSPLRTPWWPNESVTLEGRRPVTARVISSDDRWTVLLRHSVLIRVETSTIEARSYCEPEGANGWANEPLISVGADDYPTCPS